ncbi:MAG TPA: lysophospholipid acyltransferase family protein [Candidatus Methylomirabilis sp.]|nr:lysophospholipid acyltransferase family protein [Candidatus Methylomirabilis sp.]
MRAWARSLRIRFLCDGFRIENGLPATPTNGIYVFWHQRMLVLAGYFRDCGFRVLISHHGDGEMIARVIERLGMHPIRGSSTRGGARAILELIHEARERVNIAITPDGPRGPRHRFQEGAVYLASRTGLPIYPVTVAFARFARLPTWDGFMVPAPFTKALVRVGSPVALPAELDREGVEAARSELERNLRALTDSTDEKFEELWAGAIRMNGKKGP